MAVTDRRPAGPAPDFQPLRKAANDARELINLGTVSLEITETQNMMHRMMLYNLMRSKPPFIVGNAFMIDPKILEEQRVSRERAKSVIEQGNSALGEIRDVLNRRVKAFTRLTVVAFGEIAASALGYTESTLGKLSAFPNEVYTALIGLGAGIAFVSISRIRRTRKEQRSLNLEE